MSANLVLASQSPFRARILADAGIGFTAIPAEIDERAVEQPMLDTESGPADIALVLAMAKASDVSQRNSGAVVIGADQTMSLDDKLLHKPRSMEEARRRLLQLAGKTHQLHSAVCLAQNEDIVWSHCETCHITFRPFDPGFVGRHLAHVGEIALSSVGAYQIEGRGIQLVEKIEGDFFSIIGLPLIPLLHQLRERKLIDG